MMLRIAPTGLFLLVMSVFAGVVDVAYADRPRTIELPTGRKITPTAARGAVFQDLNPDHAESPGMRAGQAAALAVSGDGRTLAIQTSGFNRIYGRDLKPILALSTEYVFLFDVSGPQPRQLQVLEVPNSFPGLAWSPDSTRLFVSGGKDDEVLEFGHASSGFQLRRKIALRHAAGLGLNVSPEVAGLAVSPDGTRLLVANLQNDSVSLIDLTTDALVAEQDLRPGALDPAHKGQPGGSYPRALVWSTAERAYVACERDREIISLRISGQRMEVIQRLPVEGQPVALITNQKRSRLYAALATTGRVAVFDTDGGRLVESLDVTAPASIYANTSKLGGANSNALALTPDEDRLLVSNAGENAIAVVRLGERARDPATSRGRNDRSPTHQHGDADEDRDEDDAKMVAEQSEVVALVPTGWYPTGVATSKDGGTWYVINGKSETGANGCSTTPADCVSLGSGTADPGHRSRNGGAVLLLQQHFVWQLEKAGFLSFPAPAREDLARLTRQVAMNDHFDRPHEHARERRLFAFLHSRIHHVIYIIKENRSYDQVLGDLDSANGDPRLTFFPDRGSPNHHAIARQFVTLDNFLVSGEVSWSGWDWSVSAQTNDFRERHEPLTLAKRGMEGEDTGFNRNINLSYATSVERHAEREISPTDPDILPGERDVAAPDGPGGKEGRGYLWDMTLERGLTLRNWGFFGENRADHVQNASLLRTPYAQKTQVFFATKSALRPYSDPYFYDFGPAYPDFWRVQEWKREFAQFVAKGSAPNLMLIRLGNDHFGSFDRAIDGVDTVETQMADNDYALGLILETVARGPFAKDTLVISVEDDACDGPDHVDAHRSIALFAGPYVRQRAVVSKRYTTVSVVKTIEQILKIGPIGLDDALAAPMSDVFDPGVVSWSYQAVVPDVLRSTQLPLPLSPDAHVAYPAHTSAYWIKAMANQDFSGADRINPVSFNHALWHGLKGNEPYPEAPIRAGPQ
jgi:DNA-binding beta-propeller fold protein YncE